MSKHTKNARQGTSPGHLCIWHGLTVPKLAGLMARRPPVDLAHTAKLASVAAMSVYNSGMSALEQMVFGRTVRNTEITEAPLFLLGHWRSGTTLLHNLVTLDPAATYCNLYHVLFPGSFLLTEKVATRLTARLLPATRPMDSMPLTWSHPQEDETALLMQTLCSPYLMLAFQRDSSVYDRFFSFDEASPAEREKFKQALLTFMKKLTVRERKRLVLKSPAHTFRIPMILELFPNAKFAFIYRNPYKVFTSTMHLRRTMFEDNGFAAPDYSSLEDMTLNVYRNLFDTYERDRHLIPEGNLHEIRFEDLEQDPIREIQSLYSGLSLPGFDELEPKLSERLAEHRAHKKNQYQMEAALLDRINTAWQPAFERFGYPMESPTGDERPTEPTLPDATDPLLKTPHATRRPNLKQPT